jgi:hypothetical protein
MNKLFTIKEPIWSGRKVGLALLEMDTDRLEIEITYTRKDSTRLYPNKYWIPRDIAKKYPKQRLRGGVVVHVIPIEALREIKEEETQEIPQNQD